MNKFYTSALISVVLTVFAGTAHAQTAIRNDTPTTLYGSDLQTGTGFAVDQYGRMQCGAGTGATSLGKAEDAAHTSGDVGVMALAVRNSAGGNLTSTDLDYSPIAVDITGTVFTTLDTSSHNSSSSPVRTEDDTFANANGLMVAGGQAQDPITIDQGTNGDISPLKTTRGGKLQVAFAPATEYWKSCGTATATTGDVAIKSAVASNKIYVSAITCNNTDAAVAPNLDFKDGTTIFAKGAILADSAITTQNSFSLTFPVPVQLTSATAFNFATNTSTSSVTCCGNGFISVD